MESTRLSRVSKFFQKEKRNWQLWILLLPGLFWLLMFCYAPMGGLAIAFKDFKPKLGIMGSPWAGLKYFERFFSTNIAVNTIINTLRLSINNLLWSFPVPVLLALMINQLRRNGTKRFIQTTIYAPYFVSNVVVVSILTVILNPTTGFVNHFLDQIGIGSRMFMARPEYFVPVYVVSGIWQTAGFNTIIYLAALTAISQDLYEAAVIDGATKLKCIWHIELPAILPTIVIMFIMSAGRMLTIGYEKVYLMQTSMNLSTSEVISTYVYKVGIQSAQYSFATAVGMFNSVANLIVLLIANTLAKRITGNGLF